MRCTHLNHYYWRVVCVAFVFMISNYSGAFLIFRVSEGSKDLGIAALAMIAQNLASMVFAYPTGWLSDRMDRRFILAFGFLLTILSNTCLAYGTSFIWSLVGAGLWGAQLGTVQSLFMAKITDHTTQNLRATAFGLYYVIIAFAVLFSNKLMGYFYEQSPHMGFNASSCVVAVALVLLPFIRLKKER